MSRTVARVVLPAVLAALLSVAFSPVARGAGLTTYPVPEGKGALIAAGPDGRLWFTSFGEPGIRAPSGQYAEFGTVGHDGTFSTVRSVPYSDHGLPDVPIPYVGVLGPDGAFWFDGASIGAHSLGFERTTTAGAVTTFPDGLPGYGSETIVDGPGRTMWFTTAHRTRGIGRLLPSGAVKLFHHGVPWPVSSIVRGPGHAMWFTVDAGNRIGRITVAGKVRTFKLPRGDFADSIAEGADGNLWTVAYPRGHVTARILRITPKGKVVRRCAGVSGETLRKAPDGHLWFARVTASPEQLVRLDRRGDADAYAVGDGLRGPVFPRDGDVWSTILTSATSSGFSVVRLDPAQAHPKRVCTPRR